MLESSSKPKLFKICESDFKSPKENLILNTIFSRSQSGNPSDKRELKLYKDIIIFSKVSDRSEQKYVKLDYGVSFQIIREPTSNKKQDLKKMGKPLGLRFLADNLKPKQFYTDSLSDIDKWDI